MILELFPDIERSRRILFTPNFAPQEEFEEAFELGVIVNLDSVFPLENWPETFRGKKFFLRMDPGQGRGHHQHVKTAGKQSKFGIPPESAAKISEIVSELGATVIGLHSHAGSGILEETANWFEVAESLVSLRSFFPHIQALNLGGGFGVVQNPSQDKPLDMAAVGKLLEEFKQKTDLGGIELWIEPGRFIVAESGILLANVTQTKTKDESHRYVGVNTGFNSLMRPILYSAYHHSVNLSKIEKEHNWVVDVVGNICESGDVLARSRPFPETAEKDVILFATAGAYGRSMASEYNLRKPAAEYFLHEEK
eukprot:TRINITY_DN2718_c0_g1_i1.p1 TRINITY_DN2718_c0_g1~~TRINITY_DN2718_c0_g1_i1.p1  ORF type:complete len:309 (-),score=86.64 TRINITY_DN2718_c0_g1_i1:44-970(-)